MLRKATCISSILAACAAIAWVAILYTDDPSDFASPKSWLIAFLSVALVAGVVAGFIQLAAVIVRLTINNILVFRVAVVLSGLWLLLCFVVIKPVDKNYLGYYASIYDFIAIGITPLFMFWGIIWVSQSMSKSTSNGDINEIRRGKTYS